MRELGNVMEAALLLGGGAFPWNARVIDRAARMLSNLVNGAGQAEPIAIDEVTAGLLDARVEVAETDAGLRLRGEQPLGVEARRLLGKPTPCVGRDAELGSVCRRNVRHPRPAFDEAPQKDGGGCRSDRAPFV